MKSIFSIILSATLLTSYSMASNNVTTNNGEIDVYDYVDVNEILINPSSTLQFAYPLHNGGIGCCNHMILKHKILEQCTLAKLNSYEHKYIEELLSYGYLRKRQNTTTTLNPVSIVPSNEIRSNTPSSMQNSRPSSSMNINEPFSLLTGCIQNPRINQHPFNRK